MPEDGRAIAYVALGSNLGDRAASLAFARKEIAALPDTAILAESSVEETEPLGPVEQPAYLNQMLAIATSISPRMLLMELLAIESRAGRTRELRWGPRTLDCDIVRYADVATHDDVLTLPHPELANRAFWLRELAEVEAMLPASSGR